MRADDHALYVDFAATGRGASDAVRSAGAGGLIPDLTVVANGCAVPHGVETEGSVTAGNETPSTLAIALGDLPDGDLDLRFDIGGEIEVVALRKSGAGVEPLAFADRANVSVVDDDGESVVLVLAPECDDEEVGR